MKNSKADIKAAIFDLDGVITQTASTHARAWKIMFDQYNERRKREGNEVFAPFSIEDDYPRYIDGILRYDGVRNFLKSRNISLPEGEPNDESADETVCGLGNWKNAIFQELIGKEGVEVFEENVKQILEWKINGIKTAVISSSKNCREILKITGLRHLFDTLVDGITSEERHLRGKPEPDIFLEAAKELKVKPENAMVVEDALAGVEAAKTGNFKLVVGIQNKTDGAILLKSGADIVVKDLTEIKIPANLNPR